MHEHDNQRDAWPPLAGALFERKTYRYVAIIEGLYHSLEEVPRDYKEIILFWLSEGQAQTVRETMISTSGEISLFIIAFL
jgi:hypothetical protein